MASIQANNPGVRFAAGVEYYIEGKYIGLAGQATAGAQGEGDYKTTFTQDDAEAVNRILDDENLTDAQKAYHVRAFLFTLLGRDKPSTQPVD
jgi:hypothetical protein